MNGKGMVAGVMPDTRPGESSSRVNSVPWGRCFSVEFSHPAGSRSFQESATSLMPPFPCRSFPCINLPAHSSLSNDSLAQGENVAA